MTSLLIATGITSLQSWPSSQHPVGPSVPNSIPLEPRAIAGSRHWIGLFFPPSPQMNWAISHSHICAKYICISTLVLYLCPSPQHTAASPFYGKVCSISQ